MNDKLHNKMMEMVDKAGRKGLSSNVPFKEEQFSELVKLRQLSILQSAYQPQATEVNLPILAREDFTKDLVAIAKDALKDGKKSSSDAKAETKTEAKAETKVDYSKMTLAELKNAAKEQGVKGYSTMKKDELLSNLK